VKAMVELVRQFLHQKPFRPFRVVMKSGERHEIDDPDRIAISRSEIHWFAENERWVRMKLDEIDLVYEPRK
jgi:hypothetical protein